MGTAGAYRGVVIGQVATAANVSDVHGRGCVGRCDRACEQRGTWRRREVPRRRRSRMYQMRMVQTATERHRLGITVPSSHLGHRRHRELIVILLTVGTTPTGTATTAASTTTTGTTQITVVMVVMRGGLVFPGWRNRLGLDLHRQGRSRRRRCTIRYGQVWQTARVLSQGVHGVLRVGIAGRRPPRGNHAQVGIDREVLRAKRPERCGIVGQTRDRRLQGHYRRVQVGRLLPRVLLHVRKIVGVDGGVHGRWYHYPEV